MKITNKVTETSYIQWIEGFVKAVLEKAELQCEQVTIEDIEFSKRVFLTIDDKEFDIRTWNFRPVGTDKNGETCAENVEYTLYKMLSDEKGSHGEDISDGSIRIAWENPSKKTHPFDPEMMEKRMVEDYQARIKTLQNPTKPVVIRKDTESQNEKSRSK